jgi:hypothetical protein
MGPVACLSAPYCKFRVIASVVWVLEIWLYTIYESKKLKNNLRILSYFGYLLEHVVKKLAIKFFF